MDVLYFWQDLVSHKVEIISTLGGLGGIYMIVNTLNGKSYVGSSANLGKRLKQHIEGFSSNPHLQSAFNLYGQNVFSLIILAIVPPIKWILFFLEQMALNFIKPAYNILNLAGFPPSFAGKKAFGRNESGPPLGGRGPPGAGPLRCQEKSIRKRPERPPFGGARPAGGGPAKMRAAAKCEPLSEDTKAKISAAMRGKKHTGETKAAMRDAKRGQNNPAFGRTGKLHPMFGTVSPNAKSVYI